MAALPIKWLLIVRDKEPRCMPSDWPLTKACLTNTHLRRKFWPEEKYHRAGWRDVLATANPNRLVLLQNTLASAFLVWPAVLHCHHLSPQTFFPFQMSTYCPFNHLSPYPIPKSSLNSSLITPKVGGCNKRLHEDIDLGACLVSSHAIWMINAVVKNYPHPEWYPNMNGWEERDNLETDGLWLPNFFPSISPSIMWTKSKLAKT